MNSIVFSVFTEEALEQFKSFLARYSDRDDVKCVVTTNLGEEMLYCLPIVYPTTAQFPLITDTLGELARRLSSFEAWQQHFLYGGGGRCLQRKHAWINDNDLFGKEGELFSSLPPNVDRVFLYFTGKGCPPCKLVAPVFETMLLTASPSWFLGRVLVQDDNVDRLIQHFKVKSIPQYFYFERTTHLDGHIGWTLIDTQVGGKFHEWEKMLRLVNQHL
jgi:hypothetical protein